MNHRRRLEARIVTMNGCVHFLSPTRLSREEHDHAIDAYVLGVFRLDRSLTSDQKVSVSNSHGEPFYGDRPPDPRADLRDHHGNREAPCPREARDEVCRYVARRRDQGAPYAGIGRETGRDVRKLQAMTVASPPCLRGSGAAPGRSAPRARPGGDADRDRGRNCVASRLAGRSGQPPLSRLSVKSTVENRPGDTGQGMYQNFRVSTAGFSNISSNTRPCDSSSTAS